MFEALDHLHQQTGVNMHQTEADGEYQHCHRLFCRKEQYRRYRHLLAEEILGNDVNRVAAVTSEHHTPEESGQSAEEEHLEEIFRSLVHLLKLQKQEAD